MLFRLLGLACLLSLLTACSTTGDGTLGSLKSKSVELDKSTPGIDREQAA